jgi:hypothetical protein
MSADFTTANEQALTSSTGSDPYEVGGRISRMDVPTALSVADKYSKPSSGIGCIHSEAYETLAHRVRILEAALCDIAVMPPIDQDDAHRLRNKAYVALGVRNPAILSENTKD